MMKDGVELSVIREELGSGSAFYEGLRLYGKWMSDIIDGLESEVKLHEGELETRRNLLEVLSSEIEIAEKKNEGLRAVFDDRSAEMEHLGSTYSEKKDKLDGVISDLVSLRGRGLTEDVIAKVGKIDFVSEDDLLDRISTLQAFQVLKSELKKVDVEIQDSRSALARDDARLKVIRDEIVSQSNALDEIKRKKWMFNQSNLVVQGFLQEGYNTELLLSILEALEGLSIKGQPNTSIQRLVTGLNGYQSLEELQRACREDQDELFRIRKELTETRATLRVYKDNILSVIEEAQVRSISVFEEQGKKLGAKVEQDLGVIKNKQIADYEKVGKIAMDQLIKLHNTGVREIQNASRARARI
jgi:hypothetical protein